MPEKAHGRYLLSGGMLVCPTCGGHFEARKAPWKSGGGVYVCATRRRKPGICGNTLALPIAKTDDDILSVIEGDVLSPKFITELVRLIDSTPDERQQQADERDRLRTEVERLVNSIASVLSEMGSSWPVAVRDGMGAPVSRRRAPVVAQIRRATARVAIPAPGSSSTSTNATPSASMASPSVVLRANDSGRATARSASCSARRRVSS